MPSTLRSRFLAIEEQFLSSLTIGHTAEISFLQRWSTLLHDFNAAKESGQVDEDLLPIAHTIASRIAVLADAFLFLDSEGQRLFEAFKPHCVALLSPPISSLVKPTTPPHFQSTGQPDSDLDFVARDWLLLNIHNPYPSAALKASLAERCGRSIQDVQNWFSSARHQIGWTTLCREIFGGSRSATLEAASRAYMQGDASDGLPADIRRAFATIRDRVHGVFSPDEAFDFKDTELETDQGFSRRSSDETNMYALLDGQCASFSGDATPQIPSSAATLTYEDEDDTMPPPPIAGCKRTLDASLGDDEGQISPVSGTRPIKRMKCTPFTAPASPTDVQPVGFDGTAPIASSPHLPSLDSSSTRKRRLSDSALHNPLKRLRGLDSSPRRQAVSDPLLFGVNVDSKTSEVLDADHWLLSCFDLPAPVDLGDLDPSLNLSVEVAAFTAVQSGSRLSPPSTALVTPASHFILSDAELASMTSEVVNDSMFDSAYSSAADPCSQHYSENSSTSSPSVGSLSAVSDDRLTDGSQDWNQFMEILHSFGSPTSSISSLSDNSSSSQSGFDLQSSPSPDDITHTLFGMDASFASTDFLSDIGGFPSLQMPLEPVF